MFRCKCFDHPENMEVGNSIPEMVALENECILFCIMELLDCKDLEGCRLVNKRWKEGANLLLDSNLNSRIGYCDSRSSTPTENALFRLTTYVNKLVMEKREASGYSGKGGIFFIQRGDYDEERNDEIHRKLDEILTVIYKGLLTGPSLILQKIIVFPLMKQIVFDGIAYPFLKNVTEMIIYGGLAYLHFNEMFYDFEYGEALRRLVVSPDGVGGCKDVNMVFPNLRTLRLIWPDNIRLFSSKMSRLKVLSWRTSKSSCTISVRAWSPDDSLCDAEIPTMECISGIIGQIDKTYYEDLERIHFDFDPRWKIVGCRCYGTFVIDWWLHECLSNRFASGMEYMNVKQITIPFWVASQWPQIFLLLMHRFENLRELHFHDDYGTIREMANLFTNRDFKIFCEARLIPVLPKPVFRIRVPSLGFTYDVFDHNNNDILYAMF